MEIIIVLIIVGIYLLLRSNSNSDKTPQDNSNVVEKNNLNSHRNAYGGSKPKKEMVIESAIHSGDLISILYEDKEGNVTRRDIRPLKFDYYGRRKYINAFCMLRNGEREFYLSQIRNIKN